MASLQLFGDVHVAQLPHFITFPWQQGKMAALVWSKHNIFQLSAKMYVTFLQHKCKDYEIMQAPHILHGNRQFMQRKCGVFETMAHAYICGLRLFLHWIMQLHNCIFLEGLIWSWSAGVLFAHSSKWITPTRMGFEPTRAEHNGLAVHRLNHSATSSGELSAVRQEEQQLEDQFVLEVSSCTL